jgi:hypothetical protein
MAASARTETIMQRGLLILLLVFTPFFAACSFSMDYVVVNSSQNTVNVTYTIGLTDIDPFVALGVRIPALLSVSEMAGREWRPLSSTQFNLDRSNRAVTVALPPNQALLIHRGSEWRQNRKATTDFIINEIHLSDPGGEMSLKGDQVYKSFVVVPPPFYSFGPPTLAIMTYK